MEISKNSFIRNLKIDDAEGMYEWMHDDNVIQWFTFDGKKMTQENIVEFIEKNKLLCADNQHYAISNDGEYAGTVSLKNIDEKNRNAELAIALRTKFQGSGIAKNCIKELLRLAYLELNLHKIYLNVLSNNIRAKKFYEKMGFKLVGKSKEHIYKNGTFVDLDWYEIILEDSNGRDI